MNFFPDRFYGNKKGEYRVLQSLLQFALGKGAVHACLFIEKMVCFEYGGGGIDKISENFSTPDLVKSGPEFQIFQPGDFHSRHKGFQVICYLLG